MKIMELTVPFNKNDVLSDKKKEILEIDKEEKVIILNLKLTVDDFLQILRNIRILLVENISDLIKILFKEMVSLDLERKTFVFLRV